MHKLTAALGFALSITAGGAGATEIKALISTAVAEAMAELVPQFERASGHTLRITYGPTGGLAKRLTGGEAADLIILADTGLDELTKQGKVVPGRTDFARTGIGVAVRKGAPKPDIASPDALKRALLNARAVAHTAPAGGGITANAKDAEAAKAFIRFISAPAAAPIYAAKGLGPS